MLHLNTERSSQNSYCDYGIWALPRKPLGLSPFEVMYGRPMLPPGLPPEPPPIPSFLHSPLLAELRNALWKYVNHNFPAPDPQASPPPLQIGDMVYLSDNPQGDEEVEQIVYPQGELSHRKRRAVIAPLLIGTGIAAALGPGTGGISTSAHFYYKLFQELNEDMEQQLPCIAFVNRHRLEIIPASCRRAPCLCVLTSGAGRRLLQLSALMFIQTILSVYFPRVFMAHPGDLDFVPQRCWELAGICGHQVDARSWSHSSARDPTFNPRLSSTIHWSPLTCPPVLRSRFFTVDSVTQLYPLNQLFAPQVYSPTSLPCCVPEGVSLGNGSHGLLCWLASRWLLLMGTSNAWRKAKNETRYLFPWHAPSEVT
ncbi:uncharacterized protein LOC129656418 [Bubalus kerabau]|uniref:uncharacterized protein LOC129656418 n=1 Tax=Bubalus carabanensis TaxID=3119969 RepID=UPI00244EC697|nr:uncharacterized protein LOC129656418 [Bubalus carabanensis]